MGGDRCLFCPYAKTAPPSRPGYRALTLPITQMKSPATKAEFDEILAAAAAAGRSVVVDFSTSQPLKPLHLRSLTLCGLRQLRPGVVRVKGSRQSSRHSPRSFRSASLSKWTCECPPALPD